MSCLRISKGIKVLRQLYVKLTIFVLLPVSAPNTMYTIKLYQKQLLRDLASVNIKLKKLNYLVRV